MSRRNSEAYHHTYTVFAFKGNARHHVLTTARHSEASEAAKDVEYGEVRIVYSCGIRLFKSNRKYVCGSMDELRRLDEKARKR